MAETSAPKAKKSFLKTESSVESKPPVSTQVTKISPIEVPPIDPHPTQNFFAEFEQDAKNLKWRYILFGIFAAILAGVIFLLKPTIENLIHPHSPFEQSYNPVSQEPKSMNLEINNPDDELLTYDKTIVVSGQTTPKSTVIISNGSSNWEVNASDHGDFSQVIDLTTGINQISIFAFDPQGVNRSDSRTIYYSTEQL